uniref:Chromosome 3 open reading frame 33 n=1 Tax=Oryzias latipes TaxID=8090 RepID=A0A3P9HS36_ORYLA
MAVAGVILIARSIKLLTKFQAAREIPARFIERNVRLRGKVHSITEKGIEVEHVPIYLPVLSTLLEPCVLTTNFGVELTPEGQIWLQNTLAPTQVVWLKIIEISSSFQQGSMWGHCMNEEVLKLGLARSVPIVGVQPESRLYWRLHKRLHRAELKAEKKGRGFWKEESPWERTLKAWWELTHTEELLGPFLSQTAGTTARFIPHRCHGCLVCDEPLLLLVVKRSEFSEDHRTPKNCNCNSCK